jgi:hypothetical protein
MRSGWLLIGFLLNFSFPVGDITVLPVLGFSFMLFAVMRMEKLESAFRRVRYSLYVAIPIAAVMLALQIVSAVKGDSVGTWYAPVYLAVRVACELAEYTAMIFFYVGIKIMGTNAEVPQLEKQSSRNMTMMAVYAISFTVITLMRYFAPGSFVGFEVVIVYPFALGYIWRALNVYTAYTLMTKIQVSVQNE